MHKALLKELIDLTAPFIDRSDLIQGPGGNTSVKSENGTMIIKASGYRFEEISETQGYSLVKNNTIADYFFKLEIKDKNKEEPFSTQLIQDSILSKEDGSKYPRPSMETGFHSVLEKYVVHTHSVWTNLVNCNSNSAELINTLRQKLNIPIAYIPFVSPGLGLSYLVTQEIKHAAKNNLPVPVIFFLENHGVIAHGQNAEDVKTILTKLDQEICKLFDVQINDYPSTHLKEEGNGFLPASTFVLEQINKYKADIHFFNNVLFPDQTVFFNNNISFDVNNEKKINILPSAVFYKCNKREASSIHETMTAYLFIYDKILSSANKPRMLDGSEIDYINNMDMEKYRKSLMK